MTREQKDKILKAIAEDRNDYARDCNRRIAEENGKITGADYMLQRFLDILKTESEERGMSKCREEISREEIAALLANGGKDD